MVTNTVRIGIAGTASTGKTTLLRRIEMELRSEGITVARTGGLGKRAREIGFQKMAGHTAASTEWVITQGIADELAGTVHADVVLADRAAHDALAYYLAALELRQEEPDPATLERLNRLVDTQKYDVLFATVLDPDCTVVKKHDYDPVYRQLVDRHLHQLLNERGIGHFLVTNEDVSRDEATILARGAAGIPAGVA